MGSTFHTGYAKKVRKDDPAAGSWFKCDVSGEVTIQLSHALGNRADIDLEVQNDKGKVITTGAVPEGVENVKLNHRGPIYIRVYYYSGQADLFQYKLRVMSGFQQPLKTPKRSDR